MKKLISGVLSLALGMCPLLTKSENCSALDVSLTAKEENYLLYYPTILDSCQEKDDENRNCTKYLVRYDGLADHIEDIKDLANKNGNTYREIKEASAFKTVLNKFYKLVKERKFENNNVLIMSMDFTDIDNIKSHLKFDKTCLHLGRYPQKDEEYFKDWL